jgi:voltage-gated potassium channel
MVRKKLLIALLLIASVMAIGTAGFSLIEGWNVFDSLYMTVITITTVGFREVYPLSRPGMAFTMFLILFSMGIVFSILNMGARLIIEGEFGELLGRRKVEKRIRSLKDHFIVCGFGRMGRIISKEFRAKGVDFIVIEKEPLAAGLEEEGLLFVQGDATKDEVLREAGIEKAVGVVSVLPTDAENLFVVLTAKGLNPQLRVVARAGEEGSEQKLLRAGADRVVSPYHIGGLRIAHTILKPAVCDFIEFATKAGNLELQMEEITIQQGSKIEGQSLDRSGLGRDLGIIVVGINRPGGQMVFNPTYRTVVEAGDILIALGEARKLAQLEQLARSTA